MDYKAILNKITSNGVYKISLETFEPIKGDLPKERSNCFKCKENLVIVIAKGKSIYNRKDYYILYCPKCKTYTFKQVVDFNRKESPKFKFDNSTERIQRTMMRLKKVDEEDIEEICTIFREDWKKEDELKLKQQKRDEANRRYAYEEEVRKKEQSNFKKRLDAGEIKYDTKARAFYEVSSGKVVRKL